MNLFTQLCFARIDPFLIELQFITKSFFNVKCIWPRIRQCPDPVSIDVSNTAEELSNVYPPPARTVMVRYLHLSYDSWCVSEHYCVHTAGHYHIRLRVLLPDKRDQCSSSLLYLVNIKTCIRVIWMK